MLFFSFIAMACSLCFVGKAGQALVLQSVKVGKKKEKSADSVFILRNQPIIICNQSILNH